MKLYLENHVFNFSLYNGSCPCAGTAREPKSRELLFLTAAKHRPEQRLSWKGAGSKEISETLAVTRMLRTWERTASSTLPHRFSIRGDFTLPQPSGVTGQCLEAFLVTIMGRAGAPGIWWVGARNVARYPTVHRPAPTTNSYLAQNVPSPDVEKPCTKLTKHMIKMIHECY